jgi:hypothetical protein
MLYTASCVISIALLGAIAWSFVDPAGRSALLVSAVLAVAVQVVGFTVARLLVRKNLMLGWGLGSALRLLSVVVYALVVAKVWGAPLTAALLSFVGFLFVTTVFEPIFLKQ